MINNPNEAGRVMCAICYEGVPVDEVYKDADGQRWDLCRECGEREEEAR